MDRCTLEIMHRLKQCGPVKEPLWTAHAWGRRLHSTSALTWSFIAPAAVVRCPRHPATTSLGIVTRQDVPAATGGAPVAAIDQEHLKRGVASQTSGMFQFFGAPWHLRGGSAVLAVGAAALADVVQQIIARLQDVVS